MTESVDFSGVLRYVVRYWIFWWFNWLNAWFYWVWWILSWCIDEATKASIENTDQFLSFLYPHITHKNYNFYKLKNLANPWFYWVFHKIWLLKYSCLYKPCQEDMGTHQPIDMNLYNWISQVVVMVITLSFNHGQTNQTVRTTNTHLRRIQLWLQLWLWTTSKRVTASLT